MIERTLTPEEKSARFEILSELTEDLTYVEYLEFLQDLIVTAERYGEIFPREYFQFSLMILIDDYLSTL